MPASRLRSDHRSRRAGVENRPLGTCDHGARVRWRAAGVKQPRPCEVAFEVFVSSRGATARAAPSRVWSRDVRPGRIPISAFRLLSRLGAPESSAAIALILVAGLASTRRRPRARTWRSRRCEAGRCRLPTGARATRRPAASTTCSARAGGSTSRGTSRELANHGGKVRAQDVPGVGPGEHRPDRRLRAADQRPRLRACQGPGAALHRRGVLVGQRPCAAQPGGVQPPDRAPEPQGARPAHPRRGRSARRNQQGCLRRRLVLVDRRPAAGEAGQALGQRRPLPGGARVEAAGERHGARHRGRLLSPDRRRRGLHLCQRPPAAVHRRAGRRPARRASSAGRTIRRPRSSTWRSRAGRSTRPRPARAARRFAITPEAGASSGSTRPTATSRPSR